MLSKCTALSDNVLSLYIEVLGFRIALFVNAHASEMDFGIRIARMFCLTNSMET